MKQGEETTLIAIDKSQFRSLIEAIQNLVKVYAASQVKPDQGTEKNAHFLRVFGLSQQEIADLLGVTQQAVHEALSKFKKKQRKGRKTKNGVVESPSR